MNQRNFLTCLCVILFLLPSSALASYTITYNYDNLDRLTQVVYADTELLGSISYVYDNSGNILIVDESIPCQPGDLDCDGSINMSDVVRALQALSGFEIEQVFKAADINGDGKIGLEELAYALEKTAGQR